MKKFFEKQEDEVWIRYYNEFSAIFIDRESSGKFLIFDTLENLIKIAEKILKISKGEILYFKYSHRKDTKADPLANKSPVMCIYSDDIFKEKVWNFMSKNLGISKKIWKYDAQTEVDWKKGGRLYKEAHSK